MIPQIKRAAKTLLGEVDIGRAVTVFPDDVFIVSYPKSGNTWVRFLVGNLVYSRETVTFANIERKVPDIYQNIDRQLRRMPRPRILKSHEYFDPRYKNVIYLVRDPRDIALSYYHHHLKFRLIDESHSIAQFVAEFIAGKLDPFGSWGENVGSWMGAKHGCTGFLLMRYEDIMEQPLHELGRIASFMSLDIDDARLKRAVDLSSASVMRRLEKEEADLWRPISKTRKDKFFVRTAKSGNWKNELPEDLAEIIRITWHNQMLTFDYL